MFSRSNIIAAAVWFLQIIFAVDAAIGSTKIPQYQYLPPLKEQAEIYDGWRKERLDRIPLILQKYGVDAWIVCRHLLHRHSTGMSISLTVADQPKGICGRHHILVHEIICPVLR
jgi:hypothetical protein